MLEADDEGQSKPKFVALSFKGTCPMLTTDGTRQPYRSFTVEVTLEDGSSYVLTHLRYSEFLALDTTFKELFPSAHAVLPAFPRKTVGKPTEEQWKERCGQFDLYFTGVLAMPALAQNADFVRLFQPRQQEPDAGMRAALYNLWGPPEQVIKVVDNLPTPAMPLKPDDVLIEVFASSVNPTDLRLMEGASDILEFIGVTSFPYTPCVDVCGIVRGIGSKVTRFSVGDAVIADTGITAGGALAQFCATSESNCAKKPKNMSFVEAAAFPRSGLVAFQTLVHDLKIEDGNRKNLLILGGHTGTGSIAVQIAKYFGCSVTCTVKAGSEDWVRRLGGDHIFSSADITWWEQYKGNEFDAVFDTLGEEEGFEHAKLVLSAKGAFATELPDYLRQNSTTLSSWLLQGLVTAGRKIVSVASVGYHNAWANPNFEDLERLRACIEGGDFKTVANHYFPLKQTAEAFLLLKSGNAVGKIVVTISENADIEKELALEQQSQDGEINAKSLADDGVETVAYPAVVVKGKDLMEEDDEEKVQHNPFG